MAGYCVEIETVRTNPNQLHRVLALFAAFFMSGLYSVIEYIGFGLKQVGVGIAVAQGGICLAALASCVVGVDPTGVLAAFAIMYGIGPARKRLARSTAK